MKLIFAVAVFIIIISSYSLAYGIDQYTAAFWNLDECIGNTANDATGNGNTGTLNNVQWVTDGYSGCAAIFNGQDSKISAIKASSLDITEQVTLEAWIKLASLQDGTIFSRNGPFYIAVRNGKAHGGIHTSGGAEGWTTVDGTTSLETGQWYHIAMTYDGSLIKIFLDGVQEGSSSKSGIMVVRSQAPYIGWGEPGQNQYFHGIIDEVRVSNIARTSFDVSTTTSTSTTTTIPDFYTKEEVDALLAEKLAERDARINTLETALNTLNNLVNNLQNTVANIFRNLFGLPKGLREQMVCQAMSATNQTSATGFGLTCSIDNSGSCKCQII